MCGPKTEKILDWISQSWSALPESMIQESFLLCGVGSEINQYNQYLRELLENAEMENENVTSDSDDSELDELAFIR